MFLLFNVMFYDLLRDRANPDIAITILVKRHKES